MLSDHQLTQTEWNERVGIFRWILGSKVKVGMQICMWIIERQIVQIFGVAESLRAGEIQPGLQYHLGARTDLIAKKAEKLRILISEKASESPEKLSPNSQATQQPKLD